MLYNLDKLTSYINVHLLNVHRLYVNKQLPLSVVSLAFSSYNWGVHLQHSDPVAH